MSLDFKPKEIMDESFKFFHKVMSLVGITIYAEKNWDSKPFLILQIFNVVVGILTFIFTTGFVATNVSDLPILIEGACIWTTGVIMSITLLVCLIFRRKLRQFLIEMGFRDSIKDVPYISFVLKSKGQKGKTCELKLLVESSQVFLRKWTLVLLRVYVLSVFVTATLYICGAIYQMIVREDESLRILAFEMWFPWSLRDFPVYVASFIFHAYAGGLCCVAYPGFQTTIILLKSQTIRQLKILTFILNNLDDLVLETSTSRSELWQEACTDILSQCARHYIKLKSFSNRLNRICQPFYLTLILVAIMLVCVCSVKIAISNKTSPEVLKYYVHELCFVMVVFMFCLLGQQIQNECEKLETAVFEKWYIFDMRHKTNLRIFKMALSQRMPVNIFGSITLSLPTFTWFMRTGASFFTLMMSFLEEEQ